MSHAQISLKKHCNTRWSSKKQAVSTVYKELPKIIEALEELAQLGKNEEICSGAKNLVKQIKHFYFISSLIVWKNILEEIDNVNLLLQKKTITICTASKLLESLQITMRSIRNEKLPSFHKQSIVLANSLNIDSIFEGNRKKKVKK